MAYPRKVELRGRIVEKGSRKDRGQSRRQRAVKKTEGRRGGQGPKGGPKGGLKGHREDRGL